MPLQISQEKKTSLVYKMASIKVFNIKKFVQTYAFKTILVTTKNIRYAASFNKSNDLPKI